MLKVFCLSILMTPALVICQLGSRYNIGTSPIQANPAFTGSLDNGAINSNLTIAEYEYFIINASYQTHLRKSNSGIGLIVGTKRYEAYSVSTTGAAYSYQTKASEKLTLSIGLSAFYTADRDDYFPELDTSYFSFDGGAVLYSKKFFVALSTFDFQRKNDAINLSSFFGYHFQIKKLAELSITPVLGLALHNESGYFNARISADYKKIKFMIGGASNEFLIGLGYENGNFGLHYLFSYINGFYIDNRFSLTLKVPRSIDRKTDGFNFQLF